MLNKLVVRRNMLNKLVREGGVGGSGSGAIESKQRVAITNAVTTTLVTHRRISHASDSSIGTDPDRQVLVKKPTRLKQNVLNILEYFFRYGLDDGSFFP
ncbi:hypothetical protein RRG08_014538 [Elysia crispata]|uniref:Uncharacterized protein n=1 Tax=Elysia crispata TaxID=231223 RepID=A0AAE1B6I3_9GAST|nr:hypothetical protein RRG08_014538 [Elysia crispata]